MVIAAQLRGWRFARHRSGHRRGRVVSDRVRKPGSDEGAGIVRSCPPSASTRLPIDPARITGFV